VPAAGCRIRKPAAASRSLYSVAEVKVGSSSRTRCTARHVAMPPQEAPPQPGYLNKEMALSAKTKRPPSFRPTAHFFDGHRRPRLYRTGILSQSISLLKYPPFTSRQTQTLARLQE